MIASLLPKLPASGIHEIQAVLLLLLVFVLVFTLVARRLETPYPIMLVLAGLLLGFIPGMPRVAMNPDVIFLVVLPPLLFAAAWTTSWREFRFNLVSISMLAFGLVGFTVAGVAVAAPHLLSGFDWRLGFVLGAVVAPTDAIAATSIAQRIGLPHRIVDLLEGESLINDATGLLALEFGIAIMVRGETPTFDGGLLRLIWLTAGGLGAGLLVGFLVDRFERRVEYSPLEIVLSILVPYATYLGAEAIHASGVLAVVAAGLWLGHRSNEFYSPQVRLQTVAVWNALTFAFNGLTFILIGLQLPAIRAGIAEHPLPKVLLNGAVFSLLLILLRLCWTFPGAYLGTFVRRKLLHQQLDWPDAKQVFVLGWTGMRGVISLAAALSLPAVLDSGTPFPQRNFIVALTFIVILVTLVLQGLTLPWVIRLLGLRGGTHGKREQEEFHARQNLAQAALSRLEQLRPREPRQAGVYDHLALHYETRLHALLDQQGPDPDGNSGAAASQALYQNLLRELLSAERAEALRMRNGGEIGDELLRQLVRELDLTETRLSVSP